MKKLNKKFNYNTISRESSNGKRIYVCPDGSKVPSVTTILDSTKPPEKVLVLKNWRASVGEEKANQIVAESAGRGTRMHKYLEDYIISGELSTPGTNPFSKQSHLMASTIINKGFNNINEIWGSEVGLYYPELYAGTADALGIHNNDEAIFDYKQSNKPKKEEYIEDYFLQLTAYSIAHNKVYGTNIKKGVILMCVKPEESSPGIWKEPLYQEFILHPHNFSYWENKWWDRVEQYFNTHN